MMRDVSVRFIYFVALASGLLMQIGCQTKLSPTKTYVSPEIRVHPENLLRADTVILDARPRFDFELGHLPKAIALDPADFAKKKAPYEGELEEDMFFHARRLSRLGISPKTPVLVIGKGPLGKAEEGRLAFILTYLGVQDVVFSSQEIFRTPLVREPAPPLENVEVWKPVLQSQLLSDQKELRILGQKNSTFPSIIDVRNEKDYLHEKNHVYNAINIPWEQFIATNGTPNLALKERLKQLGLGDDQRVVVIGNDGNTGALAAFVLYKMGFTKVGLFAGGYRSIVGSNSGK